MKVTVLLKLFVVGLLFITIHSCKKDRLQPRFQWLNKPLYILTETAKVHNENLKHIDDARTTIGDYQWGDSTLSLNGPTGYNVLSKIAASKLTEAFMKEVMPDTTKLSDSGMLPDIEKSYLKWRREKTASKSYSKLRIAISKDYYEFNTFHSEWILWFIKDYLVNFVGGTEDWTNGTRSLSKEKFLSKSMTLTEWDKKDPWECNCTPQCYNEDSYKKYAQGEVKSANAQKQLTTNEIQEICAKKRFEDSGSSGYVEEYKTHYDAATKSYYVEIE